MNRLIREVKGINTEFITQYIIQSFPTFFRLLVYFAAYRFYRSKTEDSNPNLTRLTMPPYTRFPTQFWQAYITYVCATLHCRDATSARSVAVN